MNVQQLKERASKLPLEPGVYIMKDKTHTVIYVGKAKKLRNRVSQYFQDTASHTAKTRAMVSKVDTFDVIVAASEFEALVLECSLIKRHMPKYNILLKDDKGYPYIRLDMRDEYPTVSLAARVANDGAEYYGPFGSRSASQSLLDGIRLAMRLPGCNKRFPRDIGKDRVCLNYHMNQCAGWCQVGKTNEEFRELFEQIRQLLKGNYKQLSLALKEQMNSASEQLNFELAAVLRDRIKALELLNKKQLVTAGNAADMDVIGFGYTESKSCFTVLHYLNGDLLDKEYQVFSETVDPETAVSSLVKQYYLSRGHIPKYVLLPFSLEDTELIKQMLEQEYQKTLHILVPQRGDKLRLVELAKKNAFEEALRLTTKEEKLSGNLALLGKMLSIQTPKRIESFDISNISGTDIVASMVVFTDGKPRKSDYKHFKINNMTGQDDYASMNQVVYRRFARYKAGDEGFSQLPDLLLIDGGIEHARIALDALNSLDIEIPVFGMVKDDKHHTRALVTPEGDTIRIDAKQNVFAFIGTIQEETHRFAISYHKKLRSKRLRYSELDKIEGIGPTRKELLLKKYKSISAISDASLTELEQYLPKNAAHSVYAYFRKKEG